MAEYEEFKIDGGQLVEKVKELIRQGNVRQVRILKDGKVMLDIPLTAAAPAAALTVVFAPVLAAIGAFAALATECTLQVIRTDGPRGKP
jgi:hypothetical protein